MSREAGGEKLLILPKSKNGVQRKQAALACYQYQKEELKKRARARRMSVSRFLNELLWKDWI